MLDHIALHVSEYRKSKQFYALALKPLGYELIMEFGESGGFGKDGKPLKFTMDIKQWVVPMAGNTAMDAALTGESPVVGPGGY